MLAGGSSTLWFHTPSRSSIPSANSATQGPARVFFAATINFSFQLSTLNLLYIQDLQKARELRPLSHLKSTLVESTKSSCGNIRLEAAHNPTLAELFDGTHAE